MFFNNSDEKKELEKSSSSTDTKKKEGAWSKLTKGIGHAVTKGVTAVGSFAIRGVGTIGAGYMGAKGLANIVQEVYAGGLGNLEDGSKILAEAAGTAGLVCAAFNFATKGAGAGIGGIGKAGLLTGGTFLGAQLGGGIVDGFLADDKKGVSGPVYSTREEWESNREIPTFDLEAGDGETQEDASDLSFGG